MLSLIYINFNDFFHSLFMKKKNHNFDEHRFSLFTFLLHKNKAPSKSDEGEKFLLKLVTFMRCAG